MAAKMEAELNRANDVFVVPGEWDYAFAEMALNRFDYDSFSLFKGGIVSCKEHMFSTKVVKEFCSDCERLICVKCLDCKREHTVVEIARLFPRILYKASGKNVELHPIFATMDGLRNRDVNVYMDIACNIEELKFELGGLMNPMTITENGVHQEYPRHMRCGSGCKGCERVVSG